ncbi:MAG: ECF transporter S component [Defluviitaleaceae bacterium]|nr:ECF transporter S component [Defluviitaleaceae bacterium]
MQIDTRKLTTLAMMSAMAFALAAFVRVPVVLFLRYDPKDVIIAIAGLIYGPFAAFIVALVVSVTQMFTVSQTGPIGMLMNIIASTAFCCTAALIYKKNRTIKGAVIGLTVATIFATAVMMMWNYIITPVFMNVPREQVVALMIPAFLPFNLISNILNAAFTLLLYKPVRAALQSSRMLPRESDSKSGKVNWVIAAISALFIIATCVLWVLILQGII